MIRWDSAIFSSLYDRADVVVLTSKCIGFSTTIITAMVQPPHNSCPSHSSDSKSSGHTDYLKRKKDEAVCHTLALTGKSIIEKIKINK